MYSVSTRQVDGKLQFTVESHYDDQHDFMSHSRSRFPEVPSDLVILSELAVCDECGHGVPWPCGCFGGVTEWLVFGDPSQQPPYCD